MYHQRRKEMSFKSALIDDADYHSEKSIVDITFKNGKKFRYHGVTAKLWQSFKDAESKGKFFHENFKKLKCEELKK